MPRLALPACHPLAPTPQCAFSCVSSDIMSAVAPFSHDVQPTIALENVAVSLNLTHGTRILSLTVKKMNNGLTQISESRRAATTRWAYLL